jgi:hypothetical protein
LLLRRPASRSSCCITAAEERASPQAGGGADRLQDDAGHDATETPDTPQNIIDKALSLAAG